MRTWAPSGTPEDEPLPLLLVHDGPDYDALASLTQYLGAGIAGRWLPRLRAALLSAADRNSLYSASARYARALTEQVIPAVTGLVATTAGVGMGTSLGALAMLHAHCRRPGTFSGLFLQSGSFFVPRLDPQERRFRYYRRVTTFTAALERAHLHHRRRRVHGPGRAVRLRKDDRPPDDRGAGGADLRSDRHRRTGRERCSPRDRDIAMVFQSYALYPHKTVLQNLAFGLRQHKMPTAEITERVREVSRC